MFKCFICALDIYVYKDFLRHFKDVHNLRQDSEYKCMFENCFRVYSSKNSFNKHLKHEHLRCDNVDNSELPVNDEYLGIDCLFNGRLEEVVLDGFHLNGMKKIHLYTGSNITIFFTHFRNT